MIYDTRTYEVTQAVHGGRRVSVLRQDPSRLLDDELTQLKQAGWEVLSITAAPPDSVMVVIRRPSKEER